MFNIFKLFSSFEWVLALKFTRNSQSKKDKFVSFIAALSMVGIALGVASLIIVISVMNGFQKEVRDKMLSVLSHIEISAIDNNQNWRNISQQLNADKYLQNKIKGVAPFTQGQAMLILNNIMLGAAIRGIDPQLENNVSDINKNLTPNNIQLQENSFNILIGKPLANYLNVNIGNSLTLAVPNNVASPLGITPRLKNVKIVGFFDTGHYEFDSSMLVMNIKDTQKLFMLDGLNQIRVKLYDMHQAPQIAQYIEKKFPQLNAKDWGQQNKTWFSAVQTEKRMMFLILSILVAVASFNLLSTLVMSVKDKQGNIAIMRTFGASSSSIKKIFIYQGLIIGIIGTLLGLIFGCLVAYNVGSIVDFLEQLFNTKFLPQSIYLISSMPSDPRIFDIGIITISSIVMTILATIYPAHRASNLYPAQVLRHE